MLKALLIAAGLVCSGFALAGDDKAKTEAPAAFKKLDADKDGYVTKAEAEKMQALMAVFDTADESKDGKLDVAEFSKVSGTLPKN